MYLPNTQWLHQLVPWTNHVLARSLIGIFLGSVSRQENKDWGERAEYTEIHRVKAQIISIITRICVSMYSYNHAHFSPNHISSLSPGSH